MYHASAPTLFRVRASRSSQRPTLTAQRPVMRGGDLAASELIKGSAGCPGADSQRMIMLDCA